MYKVLILILILSINTALTQDSIRVHLLLSVDWEGDTLRDRNLAAMQRFNRRFPDYPVIHFLNAAYYTKNWELSAEEITRRIKSVLKSNDEIGIHIHAWQNFVEASGVEFRAGPSFWNHATSIGRGGELGDDVPLVLYTKDEIQKQIAYSKKIFKKYGLGNPKSFRGGGWMSGPHVWEALKAEGILIDSSAVPVKFVENLYPNTLLASKNRELWNGITPDFFPYQMDKRMTQFPNNAGLADYVSAEEFYRQYLQHYHDAVSTGKSDIYLHFGWHQESAVEYFEHQKAGGTKLVRSNFLARVEDGIEMITKHASQHNVQLAPKGFKHFPKPHILKQGTACAKMAGSLIFP